MATVTRYPTSDIAVSGSWTTPTNVQAADTTNLATTVFATKNTTVERQQGNFGFDAALPANAVINSVQIETAQKVSVTTGISFLENLAYIGATGGAVNSDSAEPTALTARTYANYVRPGGGTWNRADLLDGTFKTGIRARSGNSTTSVTYSWDYIRVTVDYTIPASTFTYVGSGGGVSAGAALLAKLKAFFGGGGGVSGGAATTSVTGTSNTFTYAGSGGATSGGGGIWSRIKRFLASGGGLGGGSALRSKLKAFLPTGGARSAGAAVQAKTKAFAASGGVVVGGAAVTSKSGGGAPQIPVQVHHGCRKRCRIHYI